MLDASYLMPKIDVQLAGIASYRSAVPYSVSTSFQLDTDPFTRSARAAQLAPRLDREEHRSARQQDLPASRPRTRRPAFWEMFNVFNVDNWLRYQGSLQSAQFGLPLTEGPKRRQQLGFRFDF